MSPAVMRAIQDLGESLVEHPGLVCFDSIPLEELRGAGRGESTLEVEVEAGPMCPFPSLALMVRALAPGEAGVSGHRWSR